MASGGESLAPETVRAWRTGRRMLDAYGPTESTVVALLADIGDEILLGEPIPGTGCWCSTPLCIRFRSEARRDVPHRRRSGSRLPGRPGETAARFVASTHGTGRMYRTGDRVRVGFDGRLRFLGRVDRQLKIRGARVEPAMVESALLQDSAVRRAAVTAVDGALVAFVCGDRIDPEEVLRAVTRTLPPTSVPSRLHVLDLLPTTSNGKTDFRSLTELARELADTSSGRPLSGTESVVAAVVSDVLGHRVDVDAGFFAVGGHSLAAVEVAGRLAQSLGRDVAPRAVLEAPTLAALARTIDTGAASARSELVRTDTEPVPIAPAQRRLWLLHRAEPDSADYVMPIVVRFGESLDPRALSPRPSATWWIGTKRCGRTTRTRRVRRSRAAGTSRSRSSTSPCPATSSTDGSDGWHPGRSTDVEAATARGTAAGGVGRVDSRRRDAPHRRGRSLRGPAAR
ncbi:hypothetical protein GS448_26155 [Rhodococcus hoagii]|nr:hypothetical protein [Prescottella equi]